ncbi:ssDNA-binding protein [Agrobacterium sp. CCNWLW71]|uniref:ssDNA-binding protein n=1 Tax=unclassified Agrobacterium TaxID=2632611 RepID=UPI002FEEFDCE
MAIEDKATDGRTVQLKRVRLSFTDSLKDKKKTSDDPNALPKHGLNIINEKDSPYYEENHKKIMAALRAAGEKAWKNPDAYKDIMEDNPKRVCFRKGEKFKNKEGKVYTGYEGNYAFSASGPSAGQKRPKLLDRRKRCLRDQATAEQLKAGKVFEESEILDIFYGGVFGDVIVSFFGTDKGSRGIFSSAEAIRSHEEGERMGGGIYVDADDFDDLEEDDSFDNGPSTGSESKTSASDDFDF